MAINQMLVIAVGCKILFYYINSFILVNLCQISGSLFLQVISAHFCFFCGRLPLMKHFFYALLKTQTWVTLAGADAAEAVVFVKLEQVW